MNSCTLMGGFYFEMGKALFGLTVFAGCISVFLLAYVVIGLIHRK